MKIRYHFHPTRRARDRYQLSESLFSISGSIIFADMRSAQLAAEAINAHRRAHHAPEGDLIRPAHLYAAGLMHEIIHFIIGAYTQQANPGAFAGCDRHLQDAFSGEALEGFLLTFIDTFPPPGVYRRTESPAEYLRRETKTMPHRHISLEELILIWLQNQNPALGTLNELIDDSGLKDRTPYRTVMEAVDAFFAAQPAFGPDGETLLKLLLAPIASSPGSIMGQLEFMRKRWKKILAGSPLLTKLLGAEDLLREEGKYFLMIEQARSDRSKLPLIVQTPHRGAAERGASPVARFRGAFYESEPEHFTQDLTWMPRLVLIAKSIYVWLDQLSRKYRREIRRLDQIPDEELDILAASGFTGLWLIGVWQRSRASERIKHLHGHTEAAASAYALNDYELSSELGGEEAYHNLRHRAAGRGIRMASDMVPNHMGMDSRWVIEHPDWFIRSEYPPFPNYSFNGPDLGGNDRVGIFLEDGYWTKHDAAVVFKRLDRWTGDVRYLYHGNDGTSMPWNDTAQLDFLKAEVREAVIQAILHVARLFPIIRFDAAMVLTKRHYQRLWFPEPGTGGAIPSRASLAMTKDEFDELMPQEFWREVVDRVQREVPDTLLLAEAFWLMEGYFVRTLGMHRVYNSAFMNMLKREENANYRRSVKNVLEYNREILKRHVNFMNNPDEDTAVAQFGKDDKYFGVCTMMITMPGTPMFGHGQIEGLTEKYGMEYRRAYYDEQPDHYLTGRHEREIFPLLKKRYLFSEIENFLLYDFFTEGGTVNENVFAYSNRAGEERALVVYHNSYATTRGWIRTSVRFLGSDGKMAQRTLGEGLALGRDPRRYCIFRDHVSGMEYIHSTDDLWEKGLRVELDAFKYHVFMDFREVESTPECPYAQLAYSLHGGGVPSVSEALCELQLQPVLSAFWEAVAPGSLRYLRDGWEAGAVAETVLKAFTGKLSAVIHAAGSIETLARIPDDLIAGKELQYRSLLKLLRGGTTADPPPAGWHSVISELFSPADSPQVPGWRVVLPWIVLGELDRLLPKRGESPRNVIREWHLERIIAESMRQAGVSPEDAHFETALIDVLVTLTAREPETSLASRLLAGLSQDPLRQLIGVNEYNGTQWFHKENFERTARWLFTLNVLMALGGSDPSQGPSGLIASQYRELLRIFSLASGAAYQFTPFVESLAREGSPAL